MGRGRPPKPGTVEEKAAARRERVRNNVRALRERRKHEATALAGQASTKSTSVPRRIGWLDDGNDSSDDEGPQQLYGSTSGSRKSSTTSISNSAYDIDRRKESTFGMTSAVDTKGSYSMAFIGTMRTNFLPDSVYLPSNIDNTPGRPWESSQFLWTPCAFWVTTAFAKASTQDTGLLKTAVLACGMLLKSFEVQDQSLRIAALEMYRRSLLGIRKSLEPMATDRSVRPKDPVALYLSCHAAAMFELIVNSDLAATMHHLRGVSHLICHLGDGRDEYEQSVAWLLLQDYRLAELGLCLKYRYTSFSSVKWRQFENSAFDNPNHDSRNLFVNVTDIGDKISAVMVRLDTIRLDLRRPHAVIEIRKCLDALTDIYSTYNVLYARVVEHFGTSFVYSDKVSVGSTQVSVKFQTYDIGCAWCYNLMTQVYCIETIIDAVKLLIESETHSSLGSSPAESKASGRSDESWEETIPDKFANLEKLKELRALHRSLSVKLTQSIGYFLQTDKGITGQALAIFPLDTATTMLDIEFVRLQEDVAKFIDHSKSAEFQELQKDVQNIAQARKFCKQLQERAQSFGLPPFREAANTTYVSTLKEDRLNYRAAPSP